MIKRKTQQTKMVEVPPSYSVPGASQPRKMSSKNIGISILVLAIVAIILSHKGWFVAAMVNGRPIFSWQLNSSLRSRFGQQTLEGMIGEVIIADQARAQGIVISKAEQDKKQQEVLASLGPNVKLDDLLKFQGLTKADFDNQLKLQLTVEKLLTKDLVISENDVTNFIATNAATLTATEPAALREEARQAIKTLTVNEKLQTWFTDMRQKASVMKFL